SSDGVRYEWDVSSPSSRPECRAIINSSLVGMTHADTLLPGAEILGALRAFAPGSSSMPSHAQDLQIRRRISAEFSPIPAVKTSASIPLNTADIAPISF